VTSPLRQGFNSISVSISMGIRPESVGRYCCQEKSRFIAYQSIEGELAKEKGDFAFEISAFYRGSNLRWNITTNNGHFDNITTVCVF
jgi:hypothetical protein